jgi:DNA polymerase elongation subunit (family B)
MPEDWKTSLDLLQSDRGGLILDPAVGLHEEVIELDFNSLYPNVMLKYNISPETMLCDCCTDSQKKVVPQLGYHICTSRRGLLPEVLRPILFRRFCYKARSKNRHYDQALYKEMQQAWKWVLLVCFGYTGYRNARYGRIECYESITAYSRDILLAAAETVEAAGYCVLHGIIDSLWVKPKKDVCVSPVRLSRMISERTGIRMDVEGRYRWIVFLPNKNHDVGALNRYYGLFDDGTIKIRGVEYRQKDTPRFLRHMQSDMINVFSKARCVKDFLDLIPRAVDVLCAYARRVIDHGVKLEELVFTNRASRDVSEYQVDNLVKSALFQLRDLDVHIEPGQSIRYVVSDEHSRDYRTRVCVFENLHNCRGVDVDFYLRQLAMHGESLLLPFGFTRERFYAMLERMKLPEVLNVSVLPRIGTTQTSIRVS